MNETAGPGTIYVCGACGKVSRDNYGMSPARSRGWDESCMMHAVLCYGPPEMIAEEDENLRPRWEAVPDQQRDEVNELHGKFAATKWTAPLLVQTPAGDERYACRICSCYDGLSAKEMVRLPDRPGPIVEHIAREHPAWVSVGL